MKMFTVYDAKAEYWLRPFFSQARGSGVREFADSVNDPNSALFGHPEDFTLFEIGSFDERTGIVEAYSERVSLGGAAEFRLTEKGREALEIGG